MTFASRWSPIPAAEFGYQVMAVTGAGLSQLLSTSLPDGLPPNASAAWLQAEDGGVLKYLLDGVPTLFGGLWEYGPGKLVLTNRQQLEMCAIGLRDSRVFVQFFTGRIGSAI